MQLPLVIFMPSPLDSVGKGIMFSGCPSTMFVRLFILTISLPRYLMNGLSNLDETYREYSLAPADDLVRFLRSNVKVTSGRRGSEGIDVDAGASKSIF